MQNKWTDPYYGYSYHKINGYWLTVKDWSTFSEAWISLPYNFRPLYEGIFHMPDWKEGYYTDPNAHWGNGELHNQNARAWCEKIASSLPVYVHQSKR